VSAPVTIIRRGDTPPAGREPRYKGENLRIRSTSRFLFDLLHDSEEIGKVAKFAARFKLPMHLGPSTEDSFLAADFEQTPRRWAFQDSGLSVCAQAMADNKSVDQVLAQIRNEITSWGVDPTVPFDVDAQREPAKTGG